MKEPRIRNDKRMRILDAFPRHTPRRYRLSPGRRLAPVLWLLMHECLFAVSFAPQRLVKRLIRSTGVHDL